MQLNHTNTPSTYTLEKLSTQYKEADFQAKGKKQIVTDKEISIFLNEKHWIWPIVFWSMLVGIFIFLGVMK